MMAIAMFPSLFVLIFLGFPVAFSLLGVEESCAATGASSSGLFVGSEEDNQLKARTEIRRITARRARTSCFMDGSGWGKGTRSVASESRLRLPGEFILVRFV